MAHVFQDFPYSQTTDTNINTRAFFVLSKTLRPVFDQIKNPSLTYAECHKGRCEEFSKKSYLRSTAVNTLNTPSISWCVSASPQTNLFYQVNKSYRSTIARYMFPDREA